MYIYIYILNSSTYIKYSSGISEISNRLASCITIFKINII